MDESTFPMYEYGKMILNAQNQKLSMRNTIHSTRYPAGNVFQVQAIDTRVNRSEGPRLNDSGKINPTVNGSKGN